MKNPQAQLTSILDALAKLTKQVEKLAAELDLAKPAKKAPADKPKAVPAKAAPTAKKTVKGEEKAPEKSSEKPGEKPQTVLQQVYDVICKSRKGASIEKLKEKTDLDARQLSNALYKLTKKGAVEARARGIYFKKSK